MAIPDLLIFATAIEALAAQVPEQVELLQATQARTEPLLAELVYPEALRQALREWLGTQSPTALLETIQRLMAQSGATDIDYFLEAVGERVTPIPSLQADITAAATHDPETWAAVLAYLERPLPEPPVTIVGPLLVLGIAKRLLDEPALEPEQRLDLQLYCNDAEQKLGAMRRLGKIDDEAAQQSLIEQLLTETPDLWQLLDSVLDEAA